MDISVKSVAYQTDDRSWDLSPTGNRPGENLGITLDISGFTAGTHYPNGYIPSGVPLAKITAADLYVPYAASDEVQTLTVGGSGLTSFTVTFGGQTTAAIAAAATGATVQAALQALSTIGAGNVTVTGGAGGPWTLTFTGTLGDLDNAQVTATPTGGTGTVTPATTTAGGTEGSGGLEVCAGLLAFAVKVPDIANTAINAGASLKVAGYVDLSKLPFTLSAAGQADLKLIHFVA